MAIMLNHEEPVCWANAAEQTRTRAAFKWARVDGQWCRVPSTDESGRHLTERIPQSAQFGTPLTGLRNAGIRSHVKVMKFTGDEANVKVNQGAAHDNSGDNSYERYMLGTKGRGEGWIAAGSCPVLLAMNGDLLSHKIVSKEVRDGVVTRSPCNHAALGIRNPPCPHYEAEMLARLAERQVGHDKLIAAAKDDATKLLEGQVAVQKAAADVNAATMEKVVAVQAQMADALEAFATKPDPAPAKGGK